MIHSASFRNFKGLRSVDVSLEQFTVFVGPNASGKTSILAGLHYLSQLSEKTPQELFRDDLNLRLLYSRAGAGELNLQASTAKGCRRFKAFPPLNLPPEADVRQRILEGVDYWRPTCEFNPAATEEGEWFDLRGGDARRKMSPAVFLQLEPARIASPSYSKDAEPQMGRDGSGLASVLVRMALNRGSDFNELQKKLRRIIKSLNQIQRFDRAPVRLRASEHDPMLIEYMGDTIVFDFEGAPNIPAPMVSDGTLLALAILTAAMAPDRPKLILLDNIENGLHPSAQKELVGLLEDILSQNPELQILATTHSPYLVDVLNPQQVRITTLADDGSVACAPLTDHPEYPKWKDEMLPGEFWSFIGEKWVNGRKPVASQQ